MERLGIAFSGGASPAEIVDCVKLAETLGYESAWVAEGHGGDQFAVLAACARETSRIGLGTAITSVFVRTAPTIAMAAATVDDLSGGRFILGIGSSHKVQVEAEHGVLYAKPLTAPARPSRSCGHCCATGGLTTAARRSGSTASICGSRRAAGRSRSICPRCSRR